jgi:FkbM family methyltransferase
MSALRVGPSGRVTAFEPESDNASILDRNVTLNGLSNVTVFRCAVSDCAGTVRFAKSPTNLGDHRIVPESGTGESTEVRTDSLDDMVSRNEVSLVRTRIVKIDTQGAELLVFKGAKTTLASLPENAALFVEFSPNLLRKHNLSAPGEFIQVLGLTGRNIYVVNSRYRTIHPIGTDELTRFAAGCSTCSEDVGMDLILAPRLDADVRRFIRWYAPLLKRRFLQKKMH